jgi:hypothetical protein
MVANGIAWKSLLWAGLILSIGGSFLFDDYFPMMLVGLAIMIVAWPFSLLDY